MRLSLIAALSENYVIGINNQLPWHLPTEMALFAKITTGKSVIMGRKTFEILEGGLPNRRNLVLSTKPNFSFPAIEFYSTLKAAIQAVAQEEEAFIIGGTLPYKEGIESGLVERMYLSIIHAHFDGDTFFPKFDTKFWNLVETTYYPTDEKNLYSFTHQIWDRVK